MQGAALGGDDGLERAPRTGDQALEADLLAALVEFAQDGDEIAARLVEEEPTLMGGDNFQQVLAFLTMEAPSFSLRGGTREILRGMIARGLGLR